MGDRGMKRRRGVATAAPVSTVGHSVRLREVRCHVGFLQHRKCVEGRKRRDGPIADLNGSAPKSRRCSTTSVARSIIDDGTASPSALAVLRFTTISNFTGNCTGRSPASRRAECDRHRRRRDAECLLGRSCAPAASGQAAALLPCPTTTATSVNATWRNGLHADAASVVAALQSRLMDRPVYSLKVAPVSRAIAPSVVCAALRPSRKSLSE
jgi:hypothetical protein